MTVFEMHIQVNQRLQEVASYKRDKFKPEELDLALNKAMYRLLEQGVDKKFQDSQINLSHVTALIKKNSIHEVIIPSNTDPVYEDNLNTVYAVLPQDFYWLANARVEILSDTKNCGIAPDLAVSVLTEYMIVIPFPESSGTPTQYFTDLQLVTTGYPNLYTYPTAYSTGFPSPRSRYLVIDHLLESFYRNATVRMYWERYRDVYYPNSIILVSNSPLGATGSLTMESDNVFDSQNIGSQVATPYSIYNRGLIPANTDWVAKISSVTNKEQSILYDALTNNKFYNTRSSQPVMTQTGDFLVFYRDESFLITRAYIDYIRKPRAISLALNQNCELSDTTHPRVIDLAVEILRLDTKDQAYPATVQDTELRTT